MHIYENKLNISKMEKLWFFHHDIIPPVPPALAPNANIYPYRV